MISHKTSQDRNCYLCEKRGPERKFTRVGPREGTQKLYCKDCAREHHPKYKPLIRRR